MKNVNVTSVAHGLINKLKPFSEWHDMDDRLSRASQESLKKREVFASSQGRSFVGFVGKQPEAVQASLNRANGILKQTQEPTKSADDVVPKVRSSLNRLRPQQEDIKAKRKAVQALRERAQKSTKKAESTQSKLERLKLSNPASPEVTRLQEESERAASQDQSDHDTLEKAEAKLLGDEREYKKQLFLGLLTGLEEFGAAKLDAANQLVPIGSELAETGNGVPDIDDPRIGEIETQLQALRDEPLE
jgi:DNA repair ATPase RecN